MSNLFNIFLLVISGIALMYLVINKKREPKIKKIVVIDPEAQKLYVNQKQKPDEEKTLTIQEKINLSWQFLVNIKNQILKNFSKLDQEKLEKIGDVLAENGMKYQHDIELEARVSQGFAKAKSVTKSKEQEQSLSR